MQDLKEVRESLLNLADRTEARSEVLSRTVDIGEEGGETWLHLEWDGLPDKREFTLSHLVDVKEDVPDMFGTFIIESENRHCSPCGIPAGH